MKGAIFDADGTLLDSMSTWIELSKKFFSDLGINTSPEKLMSYRDMTLEESIPQIKNDFGLERSESELIKMLQDMVENEYRHNILLKPGVKDYLKNLHENGIKIAVATSGYDYLAKSAFDRNEISAYIDEYAYSSEVGCGKDKPDIYLLAAEKLLLTPRYCVVYEDISKGIKSAEKAGFITCAVYDKTNVSETDELKRLADGYITDFSELMNGITPLDFIYDHEKIYLADKAENILAEILFPRIDNFTVDITHTFVDPSLRGQGVAGKLTEALAKRLARSGKKAKLTCPYAVKWFKEHKEYAAQAL